MCQEKLEEIEYLKQGHPDLQEVTEGSHGSIGIYEVITDSHMLAIPTKREYISPESHNSSYPCFSVFRID